MLRVVLLLFVAPLLSSIKAANPMDCHDILQSDPDSPSGVYTIYPDYQSGVQVYCDMEDGWTVIQTRKDGSLNFYRPWLQYVFGFGDADGEYWLGLENIHKLTFKPRQLLVEMEDFVGNKASARYSYFSVGGQHVGYRLLVSGFSGGGAGDSLTHHSGMKFTTFDNDQDLHSPANCAKLYYGGWWYNNCHYTNPNGVYRWGQDSTYAVGVCWKTWKGFYYSLKTLTMKISPPQ